MEKINFNYHTHTARCSHASGEDEDYVRVAIANGIERMGFSDHAPYVFPDGYEPSYHVPMARAGEYVSSIRALADKYRDSIELHVGFEMEYLPSHFERMLAIARDAGAEYLILGQHFLYDQHPNGIPTSRPVSRRKVMRDYVNTVIEGMKTGVFSYVCHPDILNFVPSGAEEYDPELDSGGLDRVFYVIEARRLALAAEELNVPLELNCLGIREGRHYPSELFWSGVGCTKAPVTVGFDAHHPEHAYDPSSFARAMEIVEKYELNYIGEPKLRPI